MGVTNLKTDELNWYAVYTKSRHERIAQTVLLNRDIVTFLPSREVMSKWKDRRKIISVPLFPSYVFVKILLKDLPIVIYSRGVLKIVGVNGKPYPIPQEQIESVMKLVNSELKYNPYPYIDIGKEVMIKNGPLEGVVGKIVGKRSSKHIFILSVDLIKRAVSVEVHVEDIELL